MALILAWCQEEKGEAGEEAAPGKNNEASPCWTDLPTPGAET